MEIKLGMKAIQVLQKQIKALGEDKVGVEVYAINNTRIQQEFATKEEMMKKLSSINQEKQEEENNQVLSNEQYDEIMMMLKEQQEELDSISSKLFSQMRVTSKQREDIKWIDRESKDNKAKVDDQVKKLSDDFEQLDNYFK